MLLQIFCAVSVWFLVGISLLRMWQVIIRGFAYVKRLHEVPCEGCLFFTGDYRLKCAVRPTIAMSEEAISCEDFQVKSYLTPKT